MSGVGMHWYLVLAGALFSIGVAGVLTRRNALIIFMSVELMLNAANLVFITFGRFLNDIDGQIFVFFVIAVAAAEVAVGLAIIMTIFRHKESLDIDKVNLMKW